LFLVTGGGFTLTSTSAVAYLWSNSATTQTITVNTAGGYRVLITDANGCKDSSNLVAVHPPPPITVNATYIIGNPANPPNSGGQVTGLPGSTLRFYLTPTGGTPGGAPSLPGSPGTYTYYVSQIVNGYESIRVPYTVTMIEPFKITDPQKVLSSKPEMQPDGSFVIRFTIFINNTSTVLLDSIKMRDDLTRVFPASVQFDVISVRASGNLIANPQYNGSSDIHLLSDVSKMNPGARDSINLAIRMIPNGFYGILKNSALLTAKTTFGSLTITSNDPSISTGVGNREPTPFEIPTVEIFVPGGFSPNQDGLNDYFVIRRPSQTTIQLEVFNRWGNVIYRSADYKNDWNGRTNQPGNVLGPEIPDGTYYYIITGNDRATGKVTRLNGFITIKR
jgi:gliding motility-associated-like protein